MDITSCTVILLILSVAPQLSLQQGQAILTIKPQLAVRGAPVVFECTTGTDMAVPVSYFFLTRTKNGIVDDVVKYDQKCSPLTKLKQNLEKEFLRATVTPASCYSMTVSNVIASEQTAAEYRCSFHLISVDYSKTSVNSQYTSLTVGDETPEVSALEVRQASDAKLIFVDNGEVNAGTNVSITCSANTVQPVPEYTITAGGQNLISKSPAAVDNGRVSVNYWVPKQTSVKIACSLNNGFGTQKSKEMLIVPVYGASHSAIVMPDSVTQQTNEEINICSLANNPAKQLSVTVQDSDSLLQEGYPRYEAKDGVSRAFIKLKDASGASAISELSITCSLAGVVETPVSKTVSIVGVEASTQAPNSAMITIGIVIAVVVVFIVVVSVIAVALKRRNSAPKNGNSDKHYDKVGQNDADAYEASAPGKKPVTVQQGDNFDCQQV